MSRVPRAKEHLKTGFTAEAEAAATFRAFAADAERDGHPNLARRWRQLAEAKDELAIRLLEVAGQVDGGMTDVKSALSGERYENDILYPKMVREVDEATAEVLLEIVARQKDHLEELLELRRQLNASRGDVSLPAEVAQGQA